MTTLLYIGVAYFIGVLVFATLGAAVLAWNDDENWHGTLIEAVLWPLAAAAIVGTFVGYVARALLRRGAP